ncbi:MAG: SMC-Scp complex subunit ScpB [Bacteroidetes bacterium CG12_big_fil_rev_8_21_14_0_65_60_17]|nr:MAG: SMC-Scp complex subunit ScpB [Bacteroidetes bacterium CG12_big_fil_rev_8_21_14_0_65_60_17]
MSNSDQTRQDQLAKAVEAIVFAADEPVTAAHIARAFADVTGHGAPAPEEVDEAVRAINEVYDSTGRSFRVERWAGGYRFATLAEVAPFMEAVHATDRQRRLTRTLMEALAILAYRQPTSRTDLEYVRGVDCDYALRKLLEYGLIDVVGRADSVGRPLLYGTTDKFLELFGLASLDDLPNLREVESILDDPAFHREKARIMMTSGLSLANESNEHGSQTQDEASD